MLGLWVAIATPLNLVLSVKLLHALIHYKPFLQSRFGRKIVLHRIFCGMTQCAMVPYERTSCHSPAFLTLWQSLSKISKSVSIHTFASEILSSGLIGTFDPFFQVDHDGEHDIPMYTKGESLDNNGYRAQTFDEDQFNSFILQNRKDITWVCEDETRWMNDGKSNDAFFGKRAMYNDPWFVIVRSIIFDVHSCWRHDPSTPFVLVNNKQISEPNYLLRAYEKHLSSPCSSFAFWLWSVLLTFGLDFLLFWGIYIFSK
jgi:hypothetical protein